MTHKQTEVNGETTTKWNCNLKLTATVHIFSFQASRTVIWTRCSPWRKYMVSPFSSVSIVLVVLLLLLCCNGHWHLKLCAYHVESLKRGKLFGSKLVKVSSSRWTCLLSLSLSLVSPVPLAQITIQGETASSARFCCRPHRRCCSCSGHFDSLKVEGLV